MSIIELKVPVIGESVTEVTLSSWLKENGSYVEQDESICEFESDKATIERIEWYYDMYFAIDKIQGGGDE